MSTQETVMDGLKYVSMKTAASVVLLCSSIPMTGCLLSASRESEVRGAYVAPTQASRIRNGHTTTQQAEDMLGIPTRINTHDDESQTWTWSWSEETESRGSVLILFSGRSENTVHESMHIRFKDGVAVKKWRD